MPIKQNLAGENLYDQRLFNQSKGMGSGFGDDDSYGVYDKPMFANTSASSIYRYGPHENALPFLLSFCLIMIASQSRSRHALRGVRASEFCLVDRYQGPCTHAMEVQGRLMCDAVHDTLSHADFLLLSFVLQATGCGQRNVRGRGA